jgi:hypothetical protein
VTRSRMLTGGLMATMAVAAGLALAALNKPEPPDRAAEFHHLVGGLGFGPGIDLSRCEAAFDPRLCPHCAWDTGPIPGGREFCPHHALTVVDFADLPDAPAR